MGKVIWKLQSVSEKKQEEVDDKIIQKITGCDQYHWQLEILREKEFAEKSVQVPDVHKKQGITAQDLSIKYIDQCTTQKTDVHALLFSAHEAKGSCHDDQKIRCDSQKRYRLKQRRLQQKADEHNDKYSNFSTHNRFILPPSSPWLFSDL